MKRGCLISFLLFAALIAGAYLYYAPRFSEPGNWVAALATGFFGLLAVGCLQNCFIHLSNLKKLRNSNGRMVPQDGKTVVAAGVIQPLRGERYTTPFTAREAVICEYEGYRMVTTGSGSSRSTQKHVSFGGMHMVPSAVYTGVGEVRLLGYPTLIGFNPEIISEAADIERAKTFCEAAKFEKMELKSAISRVKELLLDDDGSVHNDWRNKEIDLEGLTLAETCVVAGSQVVAFGIYSAEKRGIVPDFGRVDSLCRLYSGDARAVASTIKTSIYGNIFGIIFFSSLALALVPFILQQWQESL